MNEAETSAGELRIATALPFLIALARRGACGKRRRTGPASTTATAS